MSEEIWDTDTRYWLDNSGDLWTSNDAGVTWVWGDVTNTAEDMTTLGGFELRPAP